MAILTGRHGALPALSAILAIGGCAGMLTQEYGDQGFTHQRFLELDSTLGMHLGDRVLVQAQQELGQDGPVRQRPNVVTFHGDLLDLSDGWVHLLRTADDTVRIGKGNVVGVWLTQGERERWPAMLLGAAILGGAAMAIIQTQSPTERPDVGLQVGIVAAAGLGGAFLGSALGGGVRRGARLYPAPPPPDTTTRQ